jgi:membrane fusion protein (multidrug efflux system)
LWNYFWSARVQKNGPNKFTGKVNDMKKIIIAIVIVVLVVGALAGIKFSQFHKMMATPWVQPPETISSATVRQEKWQDTLKAIGSITAVQGVTVTPEVAGNVTEIAFDSGAVVEKGALLVRLDTSTEEAQLKAAEAQAEWTRVSLERARTLRADKTMSQSELDQAETAWQQAQANADAIRTTIAKKTIRAPFAGRLGIRLVNLGEHLDVGKPIVSLQSLAPVYADFSLPQQDLAQLKNGMQVRVSIDTYTNHAFEGTLTAINPDLDSSTRNIGLQATLDNADGLLRPGMFARIEVLLPGEQNVLVIPATAVLSAPYGDSVYVIEPATNSVAGGTNSIAAATNSAPNLVVRQQFIRTGQARGDFVSVETGLKPGEQIVSAGIFKLRNGAGVTVNNDIKPNAAEKPNPSET